MYDNPLLTALFDEKASTPSNRLTQLRSLFNTNARFIIVVPCTPRAIQIDPNLLYQDFYLLSHIIQVPQGLKDFRKGLEADTFNSTCSLQLTENAVTPMKGFPENSRPIRILTTYQWNPGVPYVSSERWMSIVEVDGLLVPSDTPRRFLGLSNGGEVSQPSEHMLALGLRAAPSRPPCSEQVQLEEHKEFDQIIGQKKARRAKASAILGPLLQGFKPAEYSDVESLAAAFKEMVRKGVDEISQAFNLTDIRDALWDYFEYQTHGSVMFRLIELQTELSLCEMKPSLQHLDLGQVELPDRTSAYRVLVEQTGMKINGFDNASTIKEAAQVLMDSIGFLAAGNGRPVSADSLIGLLLISLLKSSYQYTDLIPTYIRHFSRPEVNTDAGRLGYSILTMESVMYQMRQDYERLSTLSDANRQYWDSLSSYTDDVSRLKDAIESAAAVSESVLMSCSDNSSVLFYAVKHYPPAMLKYLLRKFSHVFSPDFVLKDRDRSGRTLLQYAVELGNKQATDLLLEVIVENFSEGVQWRYFNSLDDKKQAVGHALYNNDTLVTKIGHLIDWEQKNNHGLTPLLVLSSCYDHPDYENLLSLAISKWLAQRKGKASLYGQIDNKGNSLLHIINPKTAAIINKIAKINGCNLDYRNNKGRTPLMIAAKYDRDVFVQQLLELDAGIWIVDDSGLTAFDHAKGTSSTLIYNQVTKKSYRKSQGRALKVNVVGTSGLVTIFTKEGRAVHRGFDEFDNLVKNLALNYPHSWVPYSKPDTEIRLDPWKLYRFNLRNFGYHADFFLQILSYHVNFCNSDQLQDFLYSDTHYEAQSVEVKPRRHKEKRQNIDGTNKVSYSDAEINTISTFFQFSIEQLRSFHLLYARLSLCHRKISNSLHSLAYLCMYVWRLHGQFDSRIAYEYARESVRPQLVPRDFGQDISGVTFVCQARVISTLMTALERPITMIEELRESNRVLQEHRDQLGKLGEASTWPIPYFEEKRIKAMQDEEAAIVQERVKIDILTSDISETHFSLASELGSYNQFRTDCTLDFMQTIAEKYLRRDRQLKSILISIKDRLHDLSEWEQAE